MIYTKCGEIHAARRKLKATVNNVMQRLPTGFLQSGKEKENDLCMM